MSVSTRFTLPSYAPTNSWTIASPRPLFAPVTRYDGMVCRKAADNPIVMRIYVFVNGAGETGDLKQGALQQVGRKSPRSHQSAAFRDTCHAAPTEV